MVHFKMKHFLIKIFSTGSAHSTSIDILHSYIRINRSEIWWAMLWMMSMWILTIGHYNIHSVFRWLFFFMILNCILLLLHRSSLFKCLRACLMNTVLYNLLYYIIILSNINKWIGMRTISFTQRTERSRSNYRHSGHV